MVSNTRSILIGLMVGAAQFASASPAEPSVAVDTPEYRDSVAVDDPDYRTASATVAVDVPEYRTGAGSVSTDCPKKCSDAYDTCRGKPDANRSTCAAEYAQCLGFNPFGDDGSLITPTACSAPATATMASSIAKPTDTGAVPPAPIPTDCPKKCSDAYDTCRGKPDANRSTCAAEYAQCLGFNPFGDDGSLITPTACSAATATGVVTSAMKPTGTGASPSTPISTDCPAKCSKSYDECRGKPDANHSTCAAEYAQCLGYNPFGDDGSLITPASCSCATATGIVTSAMKPTGTDTPPVIVSGAGRALPAGILGAIGSIGAIGLAALTLF